MARRKSKIEEQADGTQMLVVEPEAAPEPWPVQTFPVQEVAVTPAELAACKHRFDVALVNHIRGGSADASILTILQTLDRLRDLVPTKEEPTL